MTYRTKECGKSLHNLTFSTFFNLNLLFLNKVFKLVKKLPKTGMCVEA